MLFDILSKFCQALPGGGRSGQGDSGGDSSGGGGGGKGKGKAGGKGKGPEKQTGEERKETDDALLRALLMHPAAMMVGLGGSFKMPATLLTTC
jgi:hypothetical protein